MITTNTMKVLIVPVIAILLSMFPSIAFAQSDNQPTCPSGYSLSSDGTTCNLDQSQQQQQQQPTCPSGYSLSSDGTTCNLDQSQQQQQQQPTCPSGYTLSSDGKTCTSDQPSTPTCPSGFHLENEKCVQNNLADAANQIGKIAGAVHSACSITALIGLPC
jgi:hypothetical protein